MIFRTPPKKERVAKANDPPGTPATALLSARSGYTSSAGRTPADRFDRFNQDSPDSSDSRPSAFNQTFSSPPRPVKPRTARNLFPQTSKTDKPVLVFDIETGSSEDDTRETNSDGDSISEQAVISPKCESRKGSTSILTAEGGIDVVSDPGFSGVEARTGDALTSTRVRRPASDVAGPSSTSRHTLRKNDALVPQTADEHRARIKAIIDKRDERQKRKKKNKKKQSRHGDSSGSVISGTSTDTYESIKEKGDNPYAGYLKAASYDDDDDRQSSAKKKKGSSESSSRDKNGPSKVSQGRWSEVETEKIYTKPTSGDKPSNTKIRLDFESEQKKKRNPHVDEARSAVSGTSTSSIAEASSKAASYVVDKPFTGSSSTPKSVIGNIPASGASTPNKKGVPQSAEEHKARLKEIMNKREMKNKTLKSGDGASSVSGISSRISESPSGVSGVSGKSLSNVPKDTRSDEGSKTNFSRATSDKSSNVSDRSSHVSGASSTTSSIFAATRAKLKGYLTSYSRKKRDRKRKKSLEAAQASANVQVEDERPLLSQARDISSDSPIVSDVGKPEALLSIVEMEPLDSFPEIIIRKMPEAPHSPLSHRDEDKGLESPPLNISPLKMSPLSYDENVTSVIHFPWWMDKDGDQVDEEQISGLYSGPINEHLRPHGRGEILVKGTSSQTFHGTWQDGRLTTPLTDLSADILSGPSTDDEGPVTDDENSNSSSDEPLRGSTILQAASTKYAINKHYAVKPMVAVTPEEKVSKKPRKLKPLVRYHIGDACRTPKDMIICGSKQEATESASLLKKWDGAFIKRSCGVWTYAILIERSPQPVNVLKKRLEYFYWATVWEVDPREEVEDSMLFAIDDDGSTKIIPEHIWAKYIRRVDPNPIPNIRKSDREKHEAIASKPPPSDHTSKTSPDAPSADPAKALTVTEILKERETQKARKTSDETGLHKCIESYFEAEFGKDSDDSDTRSGEDGPFYALKRTISSATEHLMNIVDSERGSSSPQVYENTSDTETERDSVDGSNTMCERTEEG